VTAAGGIPYWSKLPCIDMLGLNDGVISRSKSQGKGSNWIGHEQADANYVMSRRPELIHFGAPGGGMPVFGYKEQMKEMPVFWQDYVLCAIGGLEPYPFVTRIYVDRTSTKLGLISTPGHIDVPLYLIEGTVAMWFEDAHRFVTRLEPRRPAGIRTLSLDAGKWQIGIPAGVEAQLVDSQNGTVIATGITGDTVTTLVAPVTANLIVRVTGTKFIELYQLVLTRQQ
jgi:arabinofuranosyltransferase